MRCRNAFPWAALIALHVAAPAAAQVFDIPKLDGIAIDGRGDDWGERGLIVGALAPVSGRRPAASFFARLRLGWEERGLLVRVEVRDDQIQESPGTGALYEKDSVELFLGQKRSVRDWLQYLIGSGADPANPQLRFHIDDHRESPALRRIDAKPELASAKTPDGYAVEARLPWEAVGIAPKKGAEAIFQCVVNEVDGDGPRAQQMWFPEGGAFSDPARMHRIRLAEKPSPAVRLVALPDYRHFPRTRLNLFAAADEAGKKVEVLGRTATLAAQDGWAAATLALPPHAAGPLALALDGKPAGLLETREIRTLRQEAIARAALRFRPAVFSGDSFPECEFDEPGRMEELIGPYTLDTVFYDADFQPVSAPQRPGRYGAAVTVSGADGARFARYLTLYRAPRPVDWWDSPLSARIAFPEALGIPVQTLDEQAAALGDFLRGAFGEVLQDRSETAALLAGLAERKPGDPAVQRLAPTERDRQWWTTLRARTGQLRQYACDIRTPRGYGAEPGRRWPLLLFLHGSGERGDDLRLLGTHGPLKEIRGGREIPAVVVAPQCPSGEWWNPTQLGLLIDQLEAKYRIDPDRIYVTGLSMGGYGAWALALLTPERFAAIAPICGGGDPADAARLKDLPIWCFHGGKDAVVPPAQSETMVAAVKAAGGGPKLTIYPEAGHDSWSATYADDAFYRWLFSQVRRR